MPRGAYCVLAGTTVRGEVVVTARATLVAGGARIGGSVYARNAKSVSLIVDSRVGGSVRIDRSRRAVVRDTRVGGSIRLRWNRGPVTVTGAHVRGDVQLVSTVGRSRVADNDVAGDLRCSANRPPPAGGANRVDGRRSGQCARL